MPELSLLSRAFEENLNETINQTFEKALVLAADKIVKPRWLSQKRIKEYVDVSPQTLREWEKRGLRRSEPTPDGKVYYDLNEIDRFMTENQI